MKFAIAQPTSKAMHNLQEFLKINGTLPWLRVSLLSGAAMVGLAFPTQAQPGRTDRPDFFEEGRMQFETEIDRFQQQQPDSTPILTIENSPPRWSPVLGQDSSFVVWMPQGIISQETQIVTTSAGDVAFDVLVSNSQLGRFVVAFSEALDADLGEPGEILDRVQQRISGGQRSFSLLNQESLSINTHPTRDFTLRNSDETISYRIMLVDNQLYVLAVSQPTETATSEVPTIFFSSFQLL
jgi:hypothetical protein